MAIKIKKKLEKPEESEESANDVESGEDEAESGELLPSVPKALADDRVLLATRDTFDWLHDHRWTLLGVVAVLVVGMLVASTLRSAAQTRRAEETRALFAALDEAEAAVAAGAPAAASNAALRDAAAELTGGANDVALAANLLHGRAAAALGEGEAARTSYQAFANATGGAENVVARFGVATATAQAGNLSEALAVLDAIAESEARWRGAALLHKAQLVETYGADRRAALDAWRAAADAAVPNAANPFGGGTATARVRALELELGVEGSGEATL